MMAHESFDHQPDPVIGGLLREHLSAHDDAAFALRMRRVARGEQERLAASSPEWDQLARWLRPGLAAAAAVLAAALVGVGLSEGVAAPMSLTEALGPAEAPVELLSSGPQPDPQVLLASLLEER